MTIQDDALMKTPEVRVDNAFRALRDALDWITTLRHSADTADYVIGHSFELHTDRIWLENLDEDVLKAAHKSAAE